MQCINEFPRVRSLTGEIGLAGDFENAIAWQKKAMDDAKGWKTEVSICVMGLRSVGPIPQIFTRYSL
jgi:hypothetical protein